MMHQPAYNLILLAPTESGYGWAGTLQPWEIHPAGTHFPMAFLLGGVALDLYAWWRGRPSLNPTASGMMIAGLVTGVFTALAGLLAFLTVPAHTAEAHTMMYWHLSMATASLALFTGVIASRWRRRAMEPSRLSRVLGIAAAALLSVTGYLGGYIVYHGGAGIDPTLLASELRQGHQHGATGGPDQSSADKSSGPQHEGHQARSQQPAAERTTQHASEQKAEAKRAPEELPQIPAPDVQAAEVPPGYRVEIVLAGLDYPTSIEFDDANAIYVAEGGYIYGDEVALARLLRLDADGKRTVVTDRLEGPVTDLLWHDGRLYISHRGKISVIEAGVLRDLVTGLPSLGDHHNNQLTVGPDGKVYFGQGTVTNSGVVGLDNFKMGWLAKYPEVHDVPAKDIRLNPQAFETNDPLTLLTERPEMQMQPGEGEDAPSDQNAHGHETDQGDSGQQKNSETAGSHQGHNMNVNAAESGGHDQHSPAGGQAQGHEQEAPRTVQTFAFQPFAKTPPDEGAVRGDIKANGTILRMDPDGSNLEVYAWGLRNPFGVLWGPNDKLYASDNGYDERGSRPIAHAPDYLWEVEQDAWYGFPDFSGTTPVTDAQFRPEKGPAPKLLMRDHPPIQKPLMTLPAHAGAAKLDVSRSAQFGFEGQLFLALSGDMNPITGEHAKRSGFEVVRIDPERNTLETFFRANQRALGPKGMEYVATPGPKRPVDVCFSRDGSALYVVDVGAMGIISTAIGPTPRPFPGSGVVWRIVRPADAQKETR